MLQKSNKKVKANSSSSNPREWPMKKKVTAFISAVFPNLADCEFELIDGEYRVSTKLLLSSGGVLTAIVLAAHRFGIYADIVSEDGRCRIYLYSDPDHPTVEDLAFRCKIEE